MKTCKCCNQSKEITKFDKGRNQCKSCRNDYKKTLYTRSGSGLRNSVLKRIYGIDLDTYNRMLQEQNGVCKICKGADNGPWGTLAVDHCHETGKVRGLLCAMCNKGLGQFKDNQELLKEAIEYLKVHSFEP